MFVSVFMNHGRWVVRCPRPGCLNAEMFGSCDDGSRGGLEAGYFTCRKSHGGCGFRCDVQWPPNVEDLERLLLARPVRSTRNWTPEEDAADLLRENFTNGILPRHEMDVIGGRITVGRELPMRAGGTF